MVRKGSVKKMTVLKQRAIKQTAFDHMGETSGLKRMKEIAKSAMDTGKFNVNDVRDDLKKFRETYGQGE